MMELIDIKDRARFFNIHQKYLYEMTLYYPDDMDAEGNCRYGWFDSYFEGAPDRHAFYLHADGRDVGFALLNRHSHLGADIDRALAEFTVFPAYRGRGHAREGARLLFARFPGRWELKYNVKNAGAVRLWTSVTAPWQPVRTMISDCEAVLSFHVEAL